MHPSHINSPRTINVAETILVVYQAADKIGTTVPQEETVQLYVDEESPLLSGVGFLHNNGKQIYVRPFEVFKSRISTTITSDIYKLSQHKQEQFHQILRGVCQKIDQENRYLYQLISIAQPIAQYNLTRSSFLQSLVFVAITKGILPE